MIFKIFTYEDGHKNYGTGDISISKNSEQPEVQEFEVEDELAQKFMDNPTIYTVTVVDGEVQIK